MFGIGETQKKVNAAADAVKQLAEEARETSKRLEEGAKDAADKAKNTAEAMLAMEVAKTILLGSIAILVGVIAHNTSKD